MAKTEKQLLQEAGATITAWMIKEKPYLFALDKIIDKVKDGEVHVTLRVYKGFVTDIVEGQQVTRQTFKKEIDNQPV